MMPFVWFTLAAMWGLSGFIQIVGSGPAFGYIQIVLAIVSGVVGLLVWSRSDL